MSSASAVSAIENLNSTVAEILSRIKQPKRDLVVREFRKRYPDLEVATARAILADFLGRFRQVEEHKNYGKQPRKRGPNKQTLKRQENWEIQRELRDHVHAIVQLELQRAVLNGPSNLGETTDQRFTADQVFAAYEVVLQHYSGN